MRYCDLQEGDTVVPSGDHSPWLVLRIDTAKGMRYLNLDTGATDRDETQPRTIVAFDARVTVLRAGRDVNR